MAVNIQRTMQALISSRAMMLWRLAVILLSTSALHAQDCGPTVPVVNVDLSSATDAIFTSANIARAGNCCGTTAPDRCIAFNITLHPGAQGIIFDICAGAVPPGALFYQIDCGPPVAVGSMICLDGTGPHYLTFCKPGNNQNQYCITSVPAPTAGPDTLASEGCSAVLTSSGYDPFTIVWTSVAPGVQGSLDGLLSCTNCENPVVTAPAEAIDFADFMVCGLPLGGCNPQLVCDTVRVSFASSLAVTIEPDPPAICDGEVNVMVTAIGAGGYPPYSFAWSNGSTSVTTLITSPGTHSVYISDASGCPPAVYTFEVAQYNQPVGADAGPDQLLCSLSEPIQLAGSFFGTDSAMWSGGSGTFLPYDHDPQATYIPSPEEIEAGVLTLTLSVLPGGDCPGTTDQVTISIAPFSGQWTAVTQNISCFGADDGQISIKITNGGDGPYSIEWNQVGIEGFEMLNLPPGTYGATLYNNLGCPEELEIILTEPQQLQVGLIASENPLCHASQDGTASIAIEGGTTPYEVSLSMPEAIASSNMQDLPAGDHLVTVTDANGCVALLPFTLNAPPELFITVVDSISLCVGNEIEVAATAWGGTGGLSYTWNQGLGNAASHTVITDEDTIYSVFATDQNDCSTATVEIAVSVISMPADMLWLSPDTGICPGHSAILHAHFEGSYPPYSYTWEPALPAGPGPHMVQPEASTIYQATVSDMCANTATGQVFIEVFPPIGIEIDEILLSGCHPTSFILRDTVNTAEGFSHTWLIDGLGTLSGNPTTFEPQNPGIYEVQLEVQSAQGCRSLADDLVLIEVFPSPEANFAALPLVGYIDAPDFTFFNQSTGASGAVSWIVEDQTFSVADTLYYTFADTGTYSIQLRVENEFGCPDSIEKRVTVHPVYNIIVPNAFTPGGAGGGGYYDPSSTSNTIFYPFADYVTDMRMNIFNRWGELIFESNELNYGWDGTYRDKPCPQDVYVYKIDFVFSDGVKVSRAGDLTLFR